MLATALAVGTMLALVACAPAEPLAVDATTTPAPSPTLILPPGADPTPNPDASDGPVEPAPLPTESAPLDATISFDTGIDVEISSVTAVALIAETPGEVSGPAVVVTVIATNGATQSQSLDSAVVTVVADDGELGIGTTAGSPTPFSGEVGPGATATGTYVFMLDPAADRSVTVSVNYAAGEPVAVFTGKVS